QRVEIRYRAAVHEMACWDQGAFQAHRVLGRNEQIPMRYVLAKRAARNSNWQHIAPVVAGQEARDVAAATDPLDGFDFARRGGNQIPDLQFFDGDFTLRGLNVRALQIAHGVQVGGDRNWKP